MEEPAFGTLMDVLQWRAVRQPEAAAYIFLKEADDSEASITYSELDRRSRRIAARLLEVCRPGDRALLFFQPGLDYIAAFFGCLYAGVVAVPAYPPRLNRSLERLRSIADDAGASAVLSSPEIHALVMGKLEHIPEFRSLQWILPAALGAPSSSGSSESSGTAMAPAAVFEPARTSPGETAFLQYTSGSTSLPKGVCITHANLMHNLGQIRDSFGAEAGSRGMIWLPPYHDMGLIGGLLQPMAVGFPVILMTPASFLQRPLRWMQAISKYRCTISGGPNFAYDLCVRKITEAQALSLDLSCWKVAFTGAEPVRASVLEAFAEKFAAAGFRREAFYPCYGLAEGTLYVTGGEPGAGAVVRHFSGSDLGLHKAVETSPFEAGSVSLVGCGKAGHGQEVLIVDPDTRERLQAGAIGEIWVRGNSVAKGYWKKPEETQKTFSGMIRGAEGAPDGPEEGPDEPDAGPCMRTGDLGFMLDGELYVTGRIKDLIILRGKNHYPQDLESTLDGAHAFLVPGASAAVGWESDGEEKVVVFQELDRGARNADLTPVFQAIQESLALHHELSVAGIVLLRMGSIPRTSSGKIQRYACRKGLEAGTLEVVSQWTQGMSIPQGALA